MAKIEENFNKILEKATKNGFEFYSGEFIGIKFMGFGRFEVIVIPEESNEEKVLQFHWNELFFNHNFAKRFFGEDSYKQQLQIMVLENNPMEYLLKML